MTITIPIPLKLEHEELHAHLIKATQAGRRVGDTANTVAGVLHEHFVKEEEFALPPLGLLSDLARDQVAIHRLRSKTFLTVQKQTGATPKNENNHREVRSLPGRVIGISIALFIGKERILTDNLRQMIRGKYVHRKDRAQRSG